MGGGQRVLSIDAFRGLTISAMVFVNTVGGFESIPAWSRHAVDFGLTYVDLVAPFFIFAIALTFGLSFRKHRASEGARETYLRVLRRYFALLGMGMVGSIVATPTALLFNWGVLQAIGIAGVVTLLVIQVPRVPRALVAALLLVAYQLVLPLEISIAGTPTSVSDLVFADVHGGLVGGVGWAGMMVMGTCVAEALERRQWRQFAILGAILAAAGACLHGIWLLAGQPGAWGISKERVTMAYVLVSTGLAALVFYGTWLVYDHWAVTGGTSRFLQPQGRNAIFLYLLHGALVSLSWVYLTAHSHPALVVLSALLNVAGVGAVAYLLDRRRVYLVI